MLSTLLPKPLSKKLRQRNIQRLQHLQQAAEAKVFSILISPVLRTVDLVLVGKLLIVAVPPGFAQGLYPGAQVG